MRIKTLEVILQPLNKSSMTFDADWLTRDTMDWIQLLFNAQSMTLTRTKLEPVWDRNQSRKGYLPLKVRTKALGSSKRTPVISRKIHKARMGAIPKPNLAKRKPLSKRRLQGLIIVNSKKSGTLLAEYLEVQRLLSVLYAGQTSGGGLVSITFWLSWLGSLESKVVVGPIDNLLFRAVYDAYAGDLLNITYGNQRVVIVSASTSYNPRGLHFLPMEIGANYVAEIMPGNNFKKLMGGLDDKLYMFGPMLKEKKTRYILLRSSPTFSVKLGSIKLTNAFFAVSTWDDGADAWDSNLVLAAQLPVSSGTLPLSGHFPHDNGILSLNLESTEVSQWDDLSLLIALDGGKGAFLGAFPKDPAMKGETLLSLIKLFRLIKYNLTFDLITSTVTSISFTIEADNVVTMKREKPQTSAELSKLQISWMIGLPDVDGGYAISIEVEGIMKMGKYAFDLTMEFYPEIVVHGYAPASQFSKSDMESYLGEQGVFVTIADDYEACFFSFYPNRLEVQAVMKVNYSPTWIF